MGKDLFDLDKPEKLEQFEAMIEEMSTNQLKCEG